MSDYRTIKIFPAAIDPSQITTGSFVISVGTVNYFKVGKLYFGFNLGSAVNGLIIPFVDDSTVPLDTSNQIAVALGVTVNTVYTDTYNTATTCIYCNGGAWHLGTYGTNLEAIYGILAN